MMRLKVFSAIAVGFSIAGCDLNHNGGYGDSSKIRHYVIEAKVETPSGVVIGRSSLTARIQPITKVDHQTRPVRIRMEAIPLKLPDGRTLFVLSAGKYFHWDVLAPWVESSDQAALESGSKIQMPKDRIPDFGFFKDIRKSNTLVRFSIEDWNMNMEPGVKLVSMTIQRSDEKTYNHVIDMLPYLSKPDNELKTDQFCNRWSGHSVCPTSRWFIRSV